MKKPLTLMKPILSLLIILPILMMSSIGFGSDKDAHVSIAILASTTSTKNIVVPKNTMPTFFYTSVPKTKTSPQPTYGSMRIQIYDTDTNKLIHSFLAVKHTVDYIRYFDSSSQDRRWTIVASIADVDPNFTASGSYAIEYVQIKASGLPEKVPLSVLLKESFE